MGAIKATVHDGQVSLTGSVPWRFQADSATTAVHSLRGVREVLNTVQVRPTVSPHNLHESIAAALVRTARYDGRKIAVTSDSAGEVRLTGDVHSWSERQQANLIAWAAPGVSSVVNEIRIRS